MKTIILASGNPTKAQATLNGFRRLFPGEGFRLGTAAVASGVGDQPRGDAETRRGAANRAEGAARQVPEADFWVGIEGGVEERDGDLAAFAWVVVRSRDRVGQSRSGTFFLPPRVAELVRQGKELGEADDLVFGRTNSKQEDGAVGLLTGNVIDRAALYEHAVILALVPFRNPGLFPEVQSAVPGRSHNQPAEGS